MAYTVSRVARIELQLDMLTGGSEAAVNSFSASAKFGRAGSVLATNQPHISVVRGSLTNPTYRRLSKDEVNGIIPRTARLGTMMARDAFEWHDICFYRVEGEVGRVSVVPMGDPVETRSGLVCVRKGRGRMTHLFFGSAIEGFSNIMPPAQEAIMAR